MSAHRGCNSPCCNFSPTLRPAASTPPHASHLWDNIGPIIIHPSKYNSMERAVGDEFKSSRRSDLSLAPLIADFIQLIAVLLPQLHKFGAKLSATSGCSIGTADEVVFWELWRSLVSACMSLTVATAFASATPPAFAFGANKQPSAMPVFLAFSDIVTWLLGMLRSASWVAMKPKNGRTQRKCSSSSPNQSIFSPN